MFADELGVELTLLVPDSFDDLLKQIDDKTVHIAAAGLTITKERVLNHCTEKCETHPGVKMRTGYRR